jgi:signal peptidase I
MFTPVWKKNAKHLSKGATKFLNYKRDLLSEDRIAEIESRRKDLIQAIKSNDKDKVEEASKQLRATCENSLPREKPQGWFEENVEVMFVALVIALGLRAYYLQPFRIPTGSMQPTLNGIIGTPEKKEDWPSYPERMMEYVLRGRSYVSLKTDKDIKIATTQGNEYMIGDTQFMHFFSRSLIYKEDSRPTLFSRLLGTNPIRMPAPVNPMNDIGLGETINAARQNNGVIPAGTTIAEGIVDTGDLVFVDKFSYHFRKPKRGEVFVFDTLGIKGIQEHSGPQGGGSHYIKRLVGVPGDELSIMEPDLIVNGKVAKEAGMRRVAEGAPPFKEEHKGYVTAQFGGSRKMYLVTPEDVLSLKDEKAKPGMREYAALGDNTSSSLDSRYWGTVKEYNLVGPALFSLWPFTTGHWGFIK